MFVVESYPDLDISNGSTLDSTSIETDVLLTLSVIIIF